MFTFSCLFTISYERHCIVEEHHPLTTLPFRVGIGFGSNIWVLFIKPKISMSFCWFFQSFTRNRVHYIISAKVTFLLLILRVFKKKKCATWYCNLLFSIFICRYLKKYPQGKFKKFFKRFEYVSSSNFDVKLILCKNYLLLLNRTGKKKSFYLIKPVNIASDVIKMVSKKICLEAWNTTQIYVLHTKIFSPAHGWFGYRISFYTLYLFSTNLKSNCFR